MFTGGDDKAIWYDQCDLIAELNYRICSQLVLKLHHVLIVKLDILS